MASWLLTASRGEEEGGTDGIGSTYALTRTQACHGSEMAGILNRHQDSKCTVTDSDDALITLANSIPTCLCMRFACLIVSVSVFMHYLLTLMPLPLLFFP